MEASFWHERWHLQQIGFHQEKPHNMLVQHWPKLGLKPGTTVLVPLCGKSLDMLWLAQQGCAVLGVELSDKACKAFFTDNQLTFSRYTEPDFVRYDADELPISILAGDVFDLSAKRLANVGALYDRAATIALPQPMREQYWQLLSRCLPGTARGVVISIDDGEVCHEGPPFSVPEAELCSLTQALGPLTAIDSALSQVHPGRQPLETIYRF